MTNSEIIISCVANLIEGLQSLEESLKILLSAISDAAEPEPPTSPRNIPKQEEPKLRLEDVRAKLAGLSRLGKTAEVRSIITAHGAKKLSEVDPREYEGIIKEAEALENA